MSYTIGNGAMTIGGGSLGKTEKLPSLKLLCLDLCARHLDRLGNLGDMPTEMFIDLLSRAKDKATPTVVRRLQDENQRLLCPEVDTKYWRQAVETHILRRTMPAPGPILVKRVKEHKEELTRLQEIAPSERSSSWVTDVLTTLRALDDIPAAVGLLQQTLIGRQVAPLRKCSNAQVSSLAQSLVQRWKEAARLHQNMEDRRSAVIYKAKANGSGSGKGGGGGAGGAGKASGDSSAEKGSSPEEAKQRSIESCFQCTSWHALYWHLEILREDKVRVSSRRAREARELALQNKPKVVMGKSRGEDMNVRRGSAKGFKTRSSPGLKPLMKSEVTSITELKRTVAIGQRLSKPVDNGKRPGSDSRPQAKRPKFWK